jgi:hypothetical protein
MRNVENLNFGNYVHTFSRISQRDCVSIFEFLCSEFSSEFGVSFTADSRVVSDKEKESSSKGIVAPSTSHDATTLNEEATKEGHSNVLQR